MGCSIVTNNPLVKKKFNNVCFVEGTMEEVLIKVRNLVYENFELVTHPLGASIRIMFSPYRSIIIGKKNERLNTTHVEIIEGSIDKYKEHMKLRKKDLKNADDYALIDLTLLESAFSELENIMVS